jgi:hypothetical protein
MEKTADILILKRYCTIDEPFGKTSKIQPAASGGQWDSFVKTVPLDPQQKLFIRVYTPF